MAKTASPPRPSGSKGKSRPQTNRRRGAPQPWYQRVGATGWFVMAALVAIAAFALLQREPAVPEGPQSLPVVGADLHSLVVDPEDPKRLFIGSHQGVSVSTDRGETWEVIESLNGADAMGWAFTDDAIYVGGHPGLSVSTDNGKTFEMRNDGLPNTDIHALGAGDGVVYAASPGAGFMASTDGGNTWEVRNEQVGGAFMGKILVDPDDPDHIVAPDMRAGAAESTDGGKTWDALGGLQGAAWVTWDPTDTADIIVVSTGAAQRSTDGGATWDAVEIPAGASMIEFSPDDPETLYAAVHEDLEARVWISTDDSQTWEQL
ncbi:MAG: hypothetical protein M3N53_12755 [Actinomycetota bacterium]|nr:hypothetical protein [Actinomycetota bacterium]